jgi:hypothetical protein
MHPLLSAQLAAAIIDERHRYAEQRRRATRPHADRPREPRGPLLKAPWHAGWTPRQPTLRSD